MTFSLRFTFFLTGSTGRRIGANRLEEASVQLMDAMLVRETDVVFDSSVSAVLSTGEVDVDATVKAPNEAVAATIARDFAIESIKVAGGIAMGIFVFPVTHPRKTPRQEWHERRAELTTV